MRKSSRDIKKAAKKGGAKKGGVKKAAAKKSYAKKGGAKKGAPKPNTAQRLAKKRSYGVKSAKKGAVDAPKKAIFVKAKKTTNMQNESKYIEVENAAFLKENLLLISFSDGTKKEVDFSSFFKKNTIPYLNKYKEQDHFKDFKIEEGNVVWGKDWDLIFPVAQLYNGKIK